MYNPFGNFLLMNVKMQIVKPVKTISYSDLNEKSLIFKKYKSYLVRPRVISIIPNKLNILQHKII